MEYSVAEAATVAPVAVATEAVATVAVGRAVATALATAAKSGAWVVAVTVRVAPVAAAGTP